MKSRKDQNRYVIRVSCGGGGTGYFPDSRVFRSSDKARAMAWYINWDAIGAEPKIEIIYEELPEGRNPLFDLLLQKVIA